MKGLCEYKTKLSKANSFKKNLKRKEKNSPFSDHQ